MFNQNEEKKDTDAQLKRIFQPTTPAPTPPHAPQIL